MPEAAATSTGNLDETRTGEYALTPAHGGLIAAVGVFSAFLITDAQAGLGLALSAGAALVAAVAPRDRGDAHRRALGVAAFLLFLTPLIRDAEWLVALNLSAGAILATYAVAGGASWPVLAINPILAAHGSLDAPLKVLRSALDVVPRGAGSSLASPLRGAAMGSGLVLIFGMLFASADSAFSHLLDNLAPDEDVFASLPAKLVIGLLVLAVTGAIALVPEPRVERVSGPVRRLFTPSEWLLALAPVAALFAVFVAIQFTVLFGGNAHVLETAGLTYSEYAREGFTQLLVVSALTVALVSAAWRWSETTTAKQELTLRLLLGAICVLALVILASALHRVDLYADAFGATRARLVAGLACVWIAGLLAMIVVAIAKWDNAWIPKAVTAFTAALLLAFTAINPDARIAERNVDRFAAVGEFDVAYNSELSADATTQLLGLPDDVQDAALANERARLAESDGWRGFNTARSAARDALSP